MNKQFATTNTLVRLGDKVGIAWPSISTGLFSFDFEVAGIGGIPRGRIIEIYGPESSGKTTFTLNVIAREQKNGGLCAFIDAEHALDPTYASKIGVDVKNLIVSQPDHGEQALDTAIALVESGAISLIVIDSVAALIPKSELDGEMGESHMGQQARLMSQAMRKLAGRCSKSNVTVIFINQIREKIGVMFGSPETTTGGRGLKFYASMRIDIRRIGGEAGRIMQGAELIGFKTKLKAVKNKMAAPFGETEVILLFGGGFDFDDDFINHAVNMGVVEKSGGWLKFNGGSYHKDSLIEKRTAIESKLAKVRKEALDKAKKDSEL